MLITTLKWAAINKSVITHGSETKAIKVEARIANGGEKAGLKNPQVHL